MSAPEKTATPQDTSRVRAGIPQLVGTALKWVAAVTAILSLIFGLRQLTELVNSRRQRERQITELLSTAQMQEQAQDYSAAWNSLDQADRLASGRRQVRSAQESLAMDWLENAREGPGQVRFDDMVGKAAPVLDRAVATAEGTRKADIMAHLGWAQYLRSRDGDSGQNPESYYRQALTIDPQNAYAHAMLGHWLLWQGGKLGEARTHFSAALATGRARPYVRQLELAGLENLRSDAAEVEMIRVLNDMRKNGEQVDPHTRSAAWAIYYFRFRPGAAGRQQLLAAVSPAEELTTFGWLFDGEDFEESKVLLREFYRSILQEAAGQPREALNTSRALRSKLPKEFSPEIRSELDARIKRLESSS
jgi:Tfp pilus assembly protein PilF